MPRIRLGRKEDRAVDRFNLSRRFEHTLKFILIFVSDSFKPILEMPIYTEISLKFREK